MYNCRDVVAMHTVSYTKPPARTATSRLRLLYQEEKIEKNQKNFARRADIHRSAAGDHRRRAYGESR